MTAQALLFSIRLKTACMHKKPFWQRSCRTTRNEGEQIMHLRTIAKEETDEKTVTQEARLFEPAPCNCFLFGSTQRAQLQFDPG
ncbi:hypothetical protein AV540_16770 [Brevibacillus parabrevis]|nr:hypothetical protein AV540_16770 [Brevibacillus parabrevis]